MRGVQNPATGLGSFVRVGREAQGLSLRQAAIAWKIEKGHLSLIEAGLRTQLQAGTLLKLSRGLGVSVDTLLTLGEEDGVRTTGVATPGKATSNSS